MQPPAIAGQGLPPTGSHSQCPGPTQATHVPLLGPLLDHHGGTKRDTKKALTSVSAGQGLFLCLNTECARRDSNP